MEPPPAVSENARIVEPDDVPAWMKFWAATLQRTPEYHAWSEYDSVAIVDKFRNVVGAPLRARTDLEPSLIGLKINITHVTNAP